MGYRYIGAKTKMLSVLTDKVSSICPAGGHVVDLMCGTGAVSAALRKRGFRVTAVDLMTYAYHHARVALLFTAPPEFRRARSFVREYSGDRPRTLFPPTHYEAILQALNAVPPERGFFWREFSAEGIPTSGTTPRNYFTPENAKRIDAARAWIRRLRTEEQITDLEHSLLLHDLVMAANDVANIAGTYGHYLSKMVQRARSRVELRPSPLLILNDAGHHHVLRGSAELLAGGIQCDVCYIDPPYMKRQYAANYHILETLAREDEPEAVGVSGLRPWRDQYSNFCTKTKIRDSFRRVFTQMLCRDFLVSYSEDGLLTVSQLVDLFSEFGEVTVSTLPYKRFKSNDSELDPQLDEYLFHLRIP